MLNFRTLVVLAAVFAPWSGSRSARCAPPAPVPVKASVASSDAVAGLLKPIIEAHEIPGMVAAIVEGHGGNALEIGCAGVRRAGDKTPITIHDRMHIGSCTKSMTATMIATLVQEGALSFDTTIGEVWPELIDTMHPDWKSVPMRWLLSNQSGAPGDITGTPLWRDVWSHTGDAIGARMKLVTQVLSGPPEAAPGTKYIYSNAGFAIAGAMAETVAGESWEQLMQKRLFEPLGMSSAGFGAPGSSAVERPDEPRGHGADGKPIEPGRSADNPSAIGPAGTVHCSLMDWSRYIALHIDGARGRDTEILKAGAFAKLHEPEGAGQQAGYAMGWGVTRREWGGTGPVLTHSGSNTMWFAVTWIAPERNFGVLVACNKGGESAAKACDEAAAALIALRNERLSWP